MSHLLGRPLSHRETANQVCALSELCALGTFGDRADNWTAFRARRSAATTQRTDVAVAGDGDQTGRRAFTFARAASRSANQSALISVYGADAAGSDSSGKIAATEHSGSQAPQSMHSAGSM